MKQVMRLIYVSVLLVSLNVALADATDPAVSNAKLWAESHALYRQGKISEAVTVLEQLDKRDPNNPNVIANLAMFSGEAKLHQKAALYYKKLVQLEPDNREARLAYALYQSILLSEEKKYSDAIALLEKSVDEVPENTSLLWNLAATLVYSENHAKALAYWQRLARHEPKNMHIQSKIIQAHQALEDRNSRDQAIEKLMLMYKENIDPDFIKHNRFCREQYRIGTWTIFAFEYFDPGKRNLNFYRFSVTDHTGYEQFWISFGIHHNTAGYARMGNNTNPEMIYTLDYFEKGKHTPMEMGSTVQMYSSKPTYDELRTLTRERIKLEIKKKEKL